MSDYITRSEFKARQNISVTTDDTTIDQVITEASRMIDTMCGRRFGDAGSASARTFRPVSDRLCYVDDFHTTSGLIIKTDTGDNGTFDTTWDAADYVLEPLNGVGDNGQTGWPWYRIVAVGSRTFPFWLRPGVQITARWGWATVPADVKGATFLIANRLYEERKVPFGSVSNADFGSLPLRDQRTVTKMLYPYQRRTPVVA